MPRLQPPSKQLHNNAPTSKSQHLHREFGQIKEATIQRPSIDPSVHPSLHHIHPSYPLTGRQDSSDAPTRVVHRGGLDFEGLVLWDEFPHAQVVLRRCGDRPVQQHSQQPDWAFRQHRWRLRVGWHCSAAASNERTRRCRKNNVPVRITSSPKKADHTHTHEQHMHGAFVLCVNWRTYTTSGNRASTCTRAHVCEAGTPKHTCMHTANKLTQTHKQTDLEFAVAPRRSRTQHPVL